VVGSDQYLWAVARYIERNPLKVGLASTPEGYRWSSARAHLTGVADELLTPQAWLDPSEQTAYAMFVNEEDESMNGDIRRATSTGRPFGAESFVDMLEFQMNMVLRPQRVGRPRK